MKKLFIIIVCICLTGSAFAGFPDMMKLQLLSGTRVGIAIEIAYDKSASDVIADSDTITVTIDPTNSLSNKVAVIGVGWEKVSSNTTVATVTYDGNSCTEIDYQQSSSSDYNGVALWYCLEADIDDDSANVVVTMNAESDGITAGVMILYNVKQQAPEADNKATDTGMTASVSVTTITDGAWVVDVVSNNYSSATNTTTDSDQNSDADTQTERWTGSVGQTTSGSTFEKVLTGSQTMSWAISLSQTWGIVAASFEVAD